MPKAPSLSIVVPGLPPTDNNAYVNTKRGRSLTSSGRHWKDEVGAAIRDQSALVDRKPFRTGVYEVRIRFYFDLYAKTVDAIKKWDVSSHQKLTVDAVADMIQNDDANCVDLRVSKHQRLVGKINQTQVDVVFAGPHQRG